MKNDKKLIKRIKSQVIKSFEQDLTNSVLKELYGSASKKEIKKIKKQILRELQEEIFGSTKPAKKKKKGDKPAFEQASEDQIKSLTEVLKEKKEEADGSYTYKGFKFDVEKMKALATGKKPIKAGDNLGIERLTNGKTKEELLESIKGFNPLEIFPYKATENTSEGTLKRLDELRKIKSGEKKDQMEKSVNAEVGGVPLPGVIDERLKKMAPGNVVQNMNKSSLTPSRKEDIDFFLGKLKQGIGKLSEVEKHISYRNRKDDTYNFTFNRSRATNVLGGANTDDFSLEFDVDLNVKTGAAAINKFEFYVDSFRFDKSFFELLDIVKVLDLVGMNLSYYIMTINGINAPILQPTIAVTKKKKNLSSSTKLEKLIDDQRIVKALQRNDIANYGQLNRFLQTNDLTDLKGIGSKTADKIKEYINIKS